MPLALILLLLSGCTVDRQMVQAEVQAAANASGCLCVASKCNTVISASGQAALSGEAAVSARQVTRELTR